MIRLIRDRHAKIYLSGKTQEGSGHEAAARVDGGTVITYGLAKVLYEVVMYPVTQGIIKKVKALPEI